MCSFLWWRLTLKSTFICLQLRQFTLFVPWGLKELIFSRNLVFSTSIKGFCCPVKSQILANSVSIDEKTSFFWRFGGITSCQAASNFLQAVIHNHDTCLVGRVRVSSHMSNIMKVKVLKWTTEDSNLRHLFHVLFRGHTKCSRGPPMAHEPHFDLKVASWLASIKTLGSLCSHNVCLYFCVFLCF